MTNNLNTLEGAQQEVIDQFEANLHAKGVLDAQYNPSTGLLGLISRIPDIEPSVNINLDIALTISSSETSINYGESILLTATLLASYEGVGDVDLKTGEITGATITFKKGQTVIGTGITDNNGVATLNYTPVAADCDTTLNISAVFSGTDNFNSATSTNVNVTVSSSLTLTSDKYILSYADNEYATLTATLNSSDNVGKTITFEVRKQSDDSLVETLTADTNSSGVATVSYLGKDAGLLYIQGILGNLSDETQIQDCVIYDPATSDKSTNYNTTGTLTWANNQYTFSKTPNLQPEYYYAHAYNTAMDITGNFEISIDMKCSSVNKSNFGIGLYDTHTGQNYNALKRLQTMIYSGTYGAYATNNGTVLWNGVNTGILSNNTWYTLYLKHENGVITSKIFNGNTEIISKTTNMDISNFPYFNITIARQDNISVINWKNLKIIKL